MCMSLAGSHAVCTLSEKAFPIILTAHCLAGATKVLPVSKRALSLEGGEELSHFQHGKGPFGYRLTGLCTDEVIDRYSH